MATILDPPSEIGPAPDLSIGDLNGYFDACDEWFDQLAAWCKKHGVGDPDLVGEKIRFSVADGYAIYFVLDAVGDAVLVHAPVADNYQIPEAHARGLNLDDIRKAVERERALKAIFPGTPQ